MNLEKLTFLIDAIRHSRTLRQKLARRSHALFFLLYFSEYITSPTADFQREMFKMTEDKKNDLCVLSAFRGSAKSTIFSTSLPIWKIISGQSHFVVIASQTQHQSRQHMANIKKPLEVNKLLINDIGPFKVETSEWGFTSGLIFEQYDAKIMVVSTEQAIRGLRYKHHRPDLIILDDIEDLSSTRTKESRDRIFNWFSSEILPLGTPDTKIFVLGNFLHEYSLVGRLMAEINDGTRSGIARKYPLMDENGTCLWPGRFPTPESLKEFKRKIGDEATWEREFLLNLISSDDKLILLSWIKRYEALPQKRYEKNCMYGYQYTWAAADMAISKNETADFTAIVSAQVFRDDNELKIYILPNVFNKHVNFPEAIDLMKNLLDVYGERSSTKLYIEANAFQSGYYQQMLHDGYNQVEGIKVSEDKRTRLSMISKFIKDGTILFPKNGAETLITQLIGFGKEYHEDTVDALTMLVSQIIKEHNHGNGFRGWMKFMGVTPKKFVQQEEIKYPYVVKSPGQEITYMPNGEKLIKFSGGGTYYSPPNSGMPAFQKDTDGSYKLKQPYLNLNESAPASILPITSNTFYTEEKKSENISNLSNPRLQAILAEEEYKRQQESIPQNMGDLQNIFKKNGKIPF